MPIDYTEGPVYHLKKDGIEIGYLEKDGVKYHTFYEEGPTLTIGGWGNTGEQNYSITMYNGLPATEYPAGTYKGMPSVSFAEGSEDINQWIGSGFIRVATDYLPSPEHIILVGSPASPSYGVVGRNDNNIFGFKAGVAGTYGVVTDKVPDGFGVFPSAAYRESAITFNVTTTWIYAPSAEWKSIEYPYNETTFYFKNFAIVNDNNVPVTLWWKEKTADGTVFDFKNKGTIKANSKAPVNSLLGSYIRAPYTMYYKFSYTNSMGLTVYSPTISQTIYPKGQGGDFCLKKDTYITMADGSQKFIQDIKTGDQILGYDFENNTTTPSMVMTMQPIKRQQVGTYVIFSNGQTLCMTHGHNLYSVEYGRYLPIEGFQEGDHTLDEQGQEIEIMAIHWDVEMKTYTNFYHIISSNNTYFANGIMNAGAPIDKYRYINDIRNQIMPQTIQDLIFDEAKDTACFNFTVTDPDFIKQGTPYQYKIKKSSNRINEIERELKQSEGIVSKIAAGLKIDMPVVKERAAKYEEIENLRQQIKEWEAEYNKLLVNYSDIGEDILLPDKERRAKYFKRACKIANDNFATYEHYYTPISYDEYSKQYIMRYEDDPKWQK